MHVLNTKDNLINSISETINPNPSCLVIFESEELTPKSKIRKLFEKEKTLGILACYYDTENDVKELVEKAFKNNNISISTNLKSILISHLGTERNIVKNELNKIMTFDGNFEWWKALLWISILLIVVVSLIIKKSKK